MHLVSNEILFGMRNSITKNLEMLRIEFSASPTIQWQKKYEFFDTSDLITPKKYNSEKGASGVLYGANTAYLQLRFEDVQSLVAINTSNGIPNSPIKLPSGCTSFSCPLHSHSSTLYFGMYCSPLHYIFMYSIDTGTAKMFKMEPSRKPTALGHDSSNRLHVALRITSGTLGLSYAYTLEEKHGVEVYPFLELDTG